ncbi:aminotransferase class I/II-fold pyridoxal phosphate-dependent enzyme [Candidatus Woesearchaeota archaeon]|nr:aminotransferase class I/II-fold pyridoxal phosphate-dependent enzyme [Candidatus Woesearchaeota archaeon]
MTWKIPLFKTYSDEEDINAVTEVIKRGTFWAVGPEIEEFEKKLADYLGIKYALTFNSGTSALHTLLLAHDVKGKEVIVPSFTFIATSNAVILAGGIPVFAESESETFGLDADDVKKKITDKTKAIIPLHYGGFPSRDTKKLREIADENNLLLIEDAAESLGSSIDGKKVGTFGDSAMFSFCQNKVLATGEGGLIVTDSREIYEKAKLLRSHGRVEESEDYFSNTGDNDYIQVGYNFRMPTILAALGISQLAKTQKIIDLRRSHGHYLSKNFSEIEEITVPKELEGHYQVYQMYTIQLPDQETRDALQKHLSDAGIMSKVYFNPVHLKTIYKKRYAYSEGDLPFTENMSKNVLNVPLYPEIKKENLDYMIKSIKEFFQR